MWSTPQPSTGQERHWPRGENCHTFLTHDSLHPNGAHVFPFVQSCHPTVSLGRVTRLLQSTNSMEQTAGQQMSQLFSYTHMHVKQMPAAAHPVESTAEHSTQPCTGTQSTWTLYTQGDLTLHKHTQWNTAAVNTELPEPQDINYCGTQVPLLPSLLQYPWSCKPLFVCQNSCGSYGSYLCKNPHTFSLIMVWVFWVLEDFSL